MYAFSDSRRPNRRPEREESRSAPTLRLPSPPPSLPARPKSPDHWPSPSRGVNLAADSSRLHHDRSPPPRRFRSEADRRYHRERPVNDRDGDFRRRDPPPHGLPPFRPTLGGGNDRSRSSTPRPHRSNGSPYAGPDLESRREEREKVVFSIWPPSPERPYAEILEREERDKDRRSSWKKSSRRRRYSSDEDSEDERERRRRRRKEKERRREREDTDGEGRRDDEWAEVRRSRSPRRSRRSTHSRSRSRGLDKRQLSVATPPTPAAPVAAEDDDGPEVGPQPPLELKIAGRFEREANKNLLPGEGAAMRQYVEAGQRIPRRGEIGLDQNKIMQYEASGFVMSGSRNARMNAVRVRKEQQVINSQDKIEMIKNRKEEADRKEGEIISQFKEIVEERLREEERKRRDRA